MQLLLQTPAHECCAVQQQQTAAPCPVAAVVAAGKVPAATAASEAAATQCRPLYPPTTTMQCRCPATQLLPLLQLQLLRQQHNRHHTCSTQLQRILSSPQYLSCSCSSSSSINSSSKPQSVATSATPAAGMVRAIMLHQYQQQQQVLPLCAHPAN